MKQTSVSIRDLFLLLAGVLLTVLILVLMTAFNINALQKWDIGGDFYSMYFGSKAFLADRIDPYDSSVRLNAQQVIYGRASTSGETPYFLDIPFHILLLFFPIYYLSNFLNSFLPHIPQVIFMRAVYATVCEVAFFLFVFCSIRLIKPRPSLLLYSSFVGIFFLSFYTIESFWMISSAIPLICACSLILFSLDQEQDELAGALFAISLFRFELVGLFLLIVLLQVLSSRRLRVAAGFFMMSVVLLFIGYLLYPEWWLSYWNQTLIVIDLDFGFTIRALLREQFLVENKIIPILWSGSLIALALYEWYISLNRSARHFYWAACLSLALTPLLGLRVESQNLFALLPAWALTISVAHERWAGIGDVVFSILTFTFVVIPWLVYLQIFSIFFEHPVFFVLFISIMSILGLYWVRWWVVNPPRTFFDLKGNLS